MAAQNRQSVGQEFVILITLATFATSFAGYPPGVMGKLKFLSILKNIPTPDFTGK